MRQPRDPQGIERAKRLRREMTTPERVLWGILRAHRLERWKFTRQVSIGSFTLDFAVRRERLGVELDGQSHAIQEDYDRDRTAYLEQAGWRVIRFSNSELALNPEGVSIAILAALNQSRDLP